MRSFSRELIKCFPDRIRIKFIIIHFSPPTPRLSDNETRLKMPPAEALNQMGRLGYRVAGY